MRARRGEGHDPAAQPEHPVHYQQQRPAAAALAQGRAEGEPPRVRRAPQGAGVRAGQSIAGGRGIAGAVGDEGEERPEQPACDDAGREGHAHDGQGRPRGRRSEGDERRGGGGEGPRSQDCADQRVHEERQDERGVGVDEDVVGSVHRPAPARRQREAQGKHAPGTGREQRSRRANEA